MYIAAVVGGVKWIREIAADGRQQAVLAIEDAAVKLSVQSLQAAMSIKPYNIHSLLAFVQNEDLHVDRN